MVLVTSPELSAVKGAADAIDILLRLGTPHDRLAVILNNRSLRPAVHRTAVERMLKRPVDIEVAFDGARADQASLKAEILSLSNPHSELTRAAESLAELIERYHGKLAARGANGVPAIGLEPK